MRQAVVKIGGGALGASDTLFSDLAALQRDGVEIIVVHGGGNVVSDWQRRHGVEARFVRGLRVTDGPALEVATAVLAGLVNKELVASIAGCGGRAVGLSGVDGGIIQAEVKDSELGYVGRVTGVDPTPLEALVRSGFLPVLSPIASERQNGSAEWKGILNVNADTVAGALASEIHASTLVFLTDVEGILDETGTCVSSLSKDDVQNMIESGVINSGMIPKVEACLKASEASVRAVITDGRRPHALLDAVEGKGPGTWFGGE